MKKTSALFYTVSFLLGLASLWSIHYCYTQRQEAMSAQQQLIHCQRLVDEIQKLESRPILASDREQMASEITQSIDAASQKAQIPPAKLVRITPNPPRRVGESVYKEKPTQILLKEVTLSQVAEMLYSLSQGENPLIPKSIRLTTPRNQDTGNLWDGEIVLTYLIYDPPEIKK